MLLVVILALGASLFNAISAVIQRRVAGHPSVDKLFRGSFIKNLTLNKMWILGFVVQIVAFILQATALKNGSLIVVEPLLTFDLIFLMLIFHFRFKAHTGRREWISIIMICLGVSGLFLSSNPQTGNNGFELLRWMLAIAPILALMSLAIYIVRRTNSSHRRAAISGVAAGASYALVAIFTKLAMRQLNYGFVTFFTTWQIYAMFVAGILSVIMMQNSYGSGTVAVSQPAMEITEPVISILMGILLFGDTINHNALAIIGETVTGVIAGIGIVLLSQSDRLRATNL